jgi:glycerate 2-kinase
MHITHTQRRDQAIRIWEAGVAAVQPRICVPAALHQLSTLLDGWNGHRPYLVIGGGKAGAAMGAAAVDFLRQQGVPDTRLQGWLNVPEGSRPEKVPPLTIHPARPAGINFPTPAAVEGTLRILELVDRSPDNTVMLCLLSGGGSALLAAPVPDVSLAEKVLASKQLSAAGASIQQLNAVRKHLSQIKGGGLAQHCFASATSGRRLISLIISDVIGDSLDVIASGPTAADPTTFAEALGVLDKLGIRQQAPRRVVHYLEAGARGEHAETLKTAPRPEPELLHRVIANNAMALQAAAQEAIRLGYAVVNWGDRLEGDTQELAKTFVDHVPNWQNRRPLCVLSGGETTVRLPSQPGRGGRNQSMALALLQMLGETGLYQATLLCAGTDGEDGPTDAAGALADAEVWRQAQALHLDPADFLKRQDAYTFFEQTGGLLKTGLTDTNVMDLRVFLFS